MAPSAGTGTGSHTHKAYSVPRDYKECHSGGNRESSHYRRESGECTAGTPFAGPHRGFQVESRSVAQGEACPVGRPCAECGCPPDSRARERGGRFPKRSIVPRYRLVPDREGRGGEGRTLTPFPNQGRGSCLPGTLQGCYIHHTGGNEETRQENSGASLYHLHPAAGGRTSPGSERGADHDDSPAPV